MNDPANRDNTRDNIEAIGERNMRRLLAEAYAPERPAPAFVLSVKEAMMAAREPVETSSFSLRNYRSLLVGIAAVIAVVVGMFLSIDSGRHQGGAVWIDGKRYVPAEGGPGDSTATRDPEPDTLRPAIAGLTAR